MACKHEFSYGDSFLCIHCGVREKDTVKPMILVDFDRTLATYESWEVNGGELGAPIEPMVARVRYWLAKGKDVRIFTARAADSNPRRDRDIEAIRRWTSEHCGVALPVQNWKDFTCEALWDDLSVSVEANTGRIVRRLDLDIEE